MVGMHIMNRLIFKASNVMLPVEDIKLLICCLQNLVLVFPLLHVCRQSQFAQKFYLM